MSCGPPDAFDGPAAARLFGFLAAGATTGQLVGSVAAGTAAAVASGSDTFEKALPIILLLGSAAMMEVAGRNADALSAAAERRSIQILDSKHRAPQRDTGLSAMVSGFGIISSKPYLSMIAAFLAMNYSVSSAFYFLRQLVAATGVHSSAGRTAFFATINGTSAALILIVQVFFTGRVLGSLTPGVALSMLPLISAVLLTVIALRPSPVVVAAAEILRKLVAYGIARPAREIFFTVVPSDDKYRAKVVLDTVVQRLGDAAAALVFGLVTSNASIGPSTFPIIVVPLCITWAALAVRLGGQQHRLQSSSLPQMGQFMVSEV